MPLEEEEEAEEEGSIQEDYPDRNIEDPPEEREAQYYGQVVVSGAEQEYDLTPEEV